MYKIFINDKPLFLTVDDSNCRPSDTSLLIHFHAEDDIVRAVQVLEENEQIKRVMIAYSDLNILWESFKSSYVFIQAAGGLVKNATDHHLLIFRNGKWDLPKGKLEGIETPDVAAIREVEEECGITNTILSTKLLSTYHTYQMDDVNVLKRTHWYAMEYRGDETPKPQLEEGIVKAEWMDLEQIHEAQKNTYASIKDVLSILH